MGGVEKKKSRGESAREDGVVGDEEKKGGGMYRREGEIRKSKSNERERQ